MVGGNEVTINKVDKILNVMGSVKRAGPLGSGHAMKSLNNYVSAAGLIASFEALNTAKKYGIESRPVTEISIFKITRNLLPSIFYFQSPYYLPELFS